MEAPGFRPGPCERDASACIRRHHAFALAPVMTWRATSGGPWGEGPTLSEVALDYQVDTATGAWRNFSLAVKGACARSMWSHYQARYPELR